MTDRLRNEVALVTGSTRGIGRAIAEMFASEGARTVVCGRSKETGEEVAESIRGAGGQAVYVATDVSIEEDVQAVVEETVRAFGKLTVVVNNAAPTDLMQTGVVDGAVTELTTMRWNQIMVGTLQSVFWACKYSIPEMVKAGHGSIVNISSSAATRGMAGIDAYTAGKAGMIGMTRSIATEYGASKVRCNAIAVGLIADREDSDPSQNPLVPILQRVQLTRLGRPDDIAYAATYLASEESEFVTGVVLPVDGGLTCAIRLDVSETLRDGEMVHTSPQNGLNEHP